MSTFKNSEKLNDNAFRRQTGVTRKTFVVMVDILKKAEAKKNKLGGKPNTLCIEDRLLMCLEYLREYRTYFHIAHTYGVSESTCYRNCVWIENILVAASEFRLPSRKELLDQHDIRVIAVDAAESPIQRPKKSKGNTTQGRKRGTPSKPKS